MIPFNIPTVVGREMEYIQDVIQKRCLSGDYEYTKKCHKWFKDNFGLEKTLLTTSCTAALEMAAMLADIKKDDEVIMPSYTFVSTANAFVLRGAKIIFVDVRPDTMNLDETKVEAAITKKTKAIVPVHYAGVACEMDTIMEIAKRHNLLVIEDAAQAFMSDYKGRRCGSIGHLACYSFHETKNITCGEGGALVVNDERFIERAEIIREKGTNRSKFFRGQVDKYTWMDIGSSYLPSELNAAYLYAQLEKTEEIDQGRLAIWEQYYQGLKGVEGIVLPHIPEACRHNAHMFFIRVKDLATRTGLMTFLKQNGVNAVFHYIPLHSSPYGEKVGEMVGIDKWTTMESEKLLRLPFYYGMKYKDVEFIIHVVKGFNRLI